MKTAIVHIGAPKTGSTAIQTSFVKEAEALAAAGVRHIKFRKGVHKRLQLLSIALGGNLGKNALARSPEGSKEATKLAALKAVRSLSRQVRDASEPYILLSEEALFGIPDPKRAARLFRQMFDRVWIVAYVRSPEAHVPSAIDQRVRGGLTYQRVSNPRFLSRSVLQTLDGYTEAFGREALLVRHFHRDNLTGGSPQSDFAHVLSQIVDRSVHFDIAAAYNTSLPGAVTCALLLENEERHRAGLERTAEWLHERRAFVKELRAFDWNQSLEKLRLTDTPLLGHIQSLHAEVNALVNARYLQGQIPLSTEVTGPKLNARMARRAFHAWLGRYEDPSITAKVRELQSALRRPRVPGFQDVLK